MFLTVKLKIFHLLRCGKWEYCPTGDAIPFGRVAYKIEGLLTEHQLIDRIEQIWNKKVPFIRDALYLKDVHEAERSQNPEHVFHENMGKLKAVKRRKSLARRYFESC